MEALFRNIYLWAGVAGWILAEIIKIIIDLFREHKFKPSLLFSSGAAAVFLLYAWWARRHPESTLRRIVLASGYRLFQCCAAVVLARTIKKRK